MERLQGRIALVTGVTSDIGAATAARQLIQAIATKHGRLDVLFINAGIARIAAADSTDEAQFDELFSINVRGPYFLLKHSISVLAEVPRSF